MSYLRTHFSRIVLWHGDVDSYGTGNILDLPARQVGRVEGVQVNEDRSALASGDMRPVRRTHTLEVPVTESEAAAWMDLMGRIQDCPVQALLLSTSGGAHWAWYEPARVNLSAPGTRSLGIGKRVLRMESRVFDAAIWRDTDLLAGIPWAGTEENGGVLTHGRAGYEGPRWAVPTGAAVDILGAASGISGTDPARLEIPLPVPGVTLRLDSEGAITGTITIRDWEGVAVAAAADSTDLVVDGALASIGGDVAAWYADVVVETASRRPRLEVVRPGKALGVRRGGLVDTCAARISRPAWSPGFVSFEVDAESGDTLALTLDGASSSTFEATVVDSSGAIDSETTLALGTEAMITPPVGTSTVYVVGDPDFAGVTSMRIEGSAGVDTDTIDLTVMADLSDLTLRPRARDTNSDGTLDAPSWLGPGDITVASTLQSFTVKPFENDGGSGPNSDDIYRGISDTKYYHQTMARVPPAIEVEIRGVAAGDVGTGWSPEWQEVKIRGESNIGLSGTALQNLSSGESSLRIFGFGVGTTSVTIDLDLLTDRAQGLEVFRINPGCVVVGDQTTTGEINDALNNASGIKILGMVNAMQKNGAKVDMRASAAGVVGNVVEAISFNDGNKFGGVSHLPETLSDWSEWTSLVSVKARTKYGQLVGSINPSNVTIRDGCTNLGPAIDALYDYVNDVGQTPLPTTLSIDISEIGLFGNNVTSLGESQLSQDQVNKIVGPAAPEYDSSAFTVPSGNGILAYIDSVRHDGIL